MASYTIFDHGQTRHGEAQALLEQIRVEASQENEEVAQMNVEQYADALIEDAPYFLDDDLLKALKAQKFDSKFDLALTCMAQMPTSGIRILTMRAA
jgi:hypothetical protein